MSDLIELTAAEQARPYAKYLARPMTPPPAGVYDSLAAAIDPARALPIECRSDLLNSGYLAAERGHCVMRDGSGFVAGLTDMPNVTAEMLDWWFAWHGLERLRYAIWDPEDHHDIHVAPEHVAHRLDPRLGLRERNWGTTDVATEDIGNGMMVLDISFMSPGDFGYDMTRFADGADTAINANGGPHGAPAFSCFTHIARKTGRGLELRSRFWIGWIVVDKAPVRVGQAMPAEAVAHMAAALSRHCAKEYHNLAAILPQVYRENHGRPDDPADFLR